MKKQIKVKSIAFNLDDQLQNKLFTHSTNTTNFSNYIKSLIHRDMDGNSQQGVNIPITTKTANTVDSSLMQGLI